jgi:UDP-glucose 4-epimerase
MNILVTGGAGYIGSHIIERLNKRDKIFILDNLSTGHRKLIDKQTTFIKGDITNIFILQKIIQDNDIEIIFHLAAFLNVAGAEKYKKICYKNNVTGTRNLILACKKSNIKYFIFSSSCSVYGNTKGRVSERNKLNPQGYYAYTKYVGEKLIIKYAKKMQFKYGILRYFNVAGASSSGKIGEIEKSHGHLIKNISIEALKQKPKINIYGNNYPTKDGTCIRDYIHVLDLADVHIKGLDYLRKNKKSFIVNCGYGKGYSVLEIVNIFKKIKKNLRVNFLPKRKGDVAQVYSSDKKLKRIFKWKPRYNDINKIIKSAINFEKKIKYLRA